MALLETVGIAVKESAKKVSMEIAKKAKQMAKRLPEKAIKSVALGVVSEVVYPSDERDPDIEAVKSAVKTVRDVKNIAQKTKNICRNLPERAKKDTADIPNKDKMEKGETTKCLPEEKREVTETKMPKITIYFKCPEGMDRKEFWRQLKAQERGLNSQSVAENIANRERYANEGRASEGNDAQKIARQKAEASRLNHNLKNGMSIEDARAEAKDWIQSQAALHNPDQVAGGDPKKVSRMGDAKVNASIGSQWRSRVDQLAESINKFAEGKTTDKLQQTKLNVELLLED